MQKIDEAGRAAPLVLELVSGTARLHGEELELPLREFRLLAALAERAGQPVEATDLIKAVWTDDAEWTSKENLHVLITKLRRLIDGPTKFGKNIRNRRGFGYVLDLDPGDVVILGPSDGEPADRIVHLDEGVQEPVTDTTSSPQLEAQALELEEETRAATSAPRLARRWTRFAGVAALALVLVAGSWTAGFVLSRRNAPPQALPQKARAEDTVSKPQPKTKANTPKDKPRGATEKRDRNRRPQRRQEPVVVAQAPSTGDSGINVQRDSGSRRPPQETSTTGEKDKPASPLPAAPTRYLYLLENPETGDHFVTTDANILSNYEGRGYEGGAIARVYTEAPDRRLSTQAIATNRGTAYIFTSSSAQTKPTSTLIPLWYSTNDRGDFFYTTIEADAKKKGWRSNVAGYVRSL